MKTSNSLNELFRAVMTQAELNANRQLALISASIELWRTDHKMTQAMFADFMGVTQAMVSKWESGEYNFTVKTLAEISDRLGVSLADLFSGNITRREYLKTSIASTRTQLSTCATTSVAPAFETASAPQFQYVVINGGAA